MDKRFWISVLVLFVLSLGLGFVVHAALLGAEYAKLTGLFRTPAEQQAYFPWMVLAHALIALGFTWIYRKGLEAGKPFLGQGVRFGLAIAVLVTLPTYLIYYAVQPMPAGLVAKQMVYDVIAVVIMGIVVAWINQPPKAT
jgi:membrane protease YdiL (CAAX protease family)